MPPTKKTTGKRGRPTKSRELWLAKDPFLRALQDACRLSFEAQNLKAGDRPRQLEDSFFRAAVALENFLGDWFARCMHFDTSRVELRAREAVERYVQAQVADGGWEPEQPILARLLEQYRPSVTVTLTVPKSPSVRTARTILGTENRNRSWKNSADFKELAGRYLAHEKARTAVKTLDARDDALIDATIALRNVLAHRSPQSQDLLRAALSAKTLDGDLRVKQITDAQLGRYLQTERAGQPRYRQYYEGLAAIANKLAPYSGKPRKIWPGP